MDAGRDFSFTPGRDVTGPLPLAVCSEQNHVLLVGNTLFLTDVFLGSAENREFATNAIAWVASVADLPAIIPDPRVHRLLVLSKDALQVITSLVCLGMPATTAMLGVFLYLYRGG
jgi:hypothetical protein